MSEATARIAELEAKLARASHERDEYKKLYELVLLELERVKRHLRAQNKSERVDALQVQMAFREVADLILPPALAEQIAASENEAREAESRAPPLRGKPHGRGKLPEHLPVERIVIHPPDTLLQCGCCGKAMYPIGEETSEQLDYRPASLVRVQIARIKYACACEQGGVVVPSRSDGREAPVIEKGLAAPGLLAHVVVSKYADHLPLHRLEERFTREGVHIARSTMCDWVGQVADLLAPITDAMSKTMLGAHRVHTDDTGIPILAPGATHKGHVWVYIADDDHVVFRYTPRRKGDGPREFLRGYKGYLQADAANLYDRLFGDGEDGEAAATEVGCWAHARRRFFEAQLTDRERALIGLGFIKKLYEADHVASRAPPIRRTALRRELASPVLEGFKAWLDAESLEVLPKAPIAEAIGYVRNQWGALTRFVEDARLKLDNNAAERQLRRVALGRKNWLFAGSEQGAERACVLYSLLASCKLHAVNPFDYLRDVLVRVGDHPARDVLALSPKLWKKPAEHLDAPKNATTATA